MKWLKRFFCRHYKVTFVRNIYGDEIIERGLERSLWKCERCGATVPSAYLHSTGEQT